MTPSKDENSKPGREPLLLRFRSSKRMILCTITMASFTDTFLYSIVVPVFPTSLVTRANVHPENVQSWLSILLAIYGATLLVAAPITGYILDKCSSRRIPFLTGLITLIGGTAMICVGNSTGLLIAGRVVSGASAAIVWTASAAMIIANIQEAEVGKALGLAALALNMGGMAGPILGGIVYDHGGYYAVYGMAFGVLMVDVILRIIMIEKTDAAKWIKKETSEKPTESTINTDSIVVDQPPSNADIQPQRAWKRRLPLMIQLLASYRIFIAIVGSFVTALLLAAFETVLPLFVETNFHFTATGAGLIFIPLILPSLFDPLFGHWCDKHPRAGRFIAAAGFLCAMPPLVLLRLVKGGDTGQVVLLCGLLAIIGLCIAMTAPPLMIEINQGIAAFEQKHPGVFGSRGAVGQGYALFICAFAAGTLLGPLLAGSLKEKSNWGTMGWVLGLFSGVTAIPIGLWLNGWIGSVKRE
ncbi:related to vesicular amine transporter [Ramularia collo-cygni]|uniref:Related to vesicular amine transporter n=1 Tax=Ramularia collo-cygni TaxID=112498 RepID=A0A2D3ULF1_9PEZI|nr:related to vesicular amine transporter [Ramularia collo-cygni]CZT14732.1 related to vesicular amine transporter [Ramularia collo-cygni]